MVMTTKNDLFYGAVRFVAIAVIVGTILAFLSQLAGCSTAERDALVVEMQATRAALVDLAENPTTDKASASLAASLERSLGVAEANLPVVTTPEEAVGAIGGFLSDAGVPFAGLGALAVTGFLGWMRERKTSKNIVENISSARVDSSVPGQIVIDETVLRQLNKATGVQGRVKANK